MSIVTRFGVSLGTNLISILQFAYYIVGYICKCAHANLFFHISGTAGADFTEICIVREPFARILHKFWMGYICTRERMHPFSVSMRCVDTWCATTEQVAMRFIHVASGVHFHVRTHFPYLKNRGIRRAKILCIVIEPSTMSFTQVMTGDSRTCARATAPTFKPIYWLQLVHLPKDILLVCENTGIFLALCSKTFIPVSLKRNWVPAWDYSQKNGGSVPICAWYCRTHICYD